MPRYKLQLKAEIVVPERDGQPELTITPAEIRESLLKTAKDTNGYAVCAPNMTSKLTATLHVTSVKFEPITCEHCGHKVAVPE
jgi:hypothetical protein